MYVEILQNFAVWTGKWRVSVDGPASRGDNVASYERPTTVVSHAWLQLGPQGNSHTSVAFYAIL